MRRPSIFRAVVAASLLVAPVAGQVAAPPSSPQAPPATAAPAAVKPMVSGKSAIIERVLVRVNGEIFTQTELERRQIDALRDQKREVTDPRALEDDASLRTLLAQVTPEILVQAVEELLLMQRGRELGLTFTDAQFKLAVDNVKKQNNWDDKSLSEALAQAGLSTQQLRQQFEGRYLIQGVQQQEIQLNLTEEEARQYYASHPDEFIRPATLTLREISVTVPTQGKGAQAMISVGTDNDAKAKIEAARARVLKGEDFAVVAAEVSDSGSKANGGLIGQVQLEQLNPSLREALEKLQVGGVSEAMRTQTGYQMFKVDARTAPEREPFTKVRDQIGSRIYEDRVDAETKKLITRLRMQALIEWKDQAYKQMYEKKLAEKTAEKNQD